MPVTGTANCVPEVGEGVAVWAAAAGDPQELALGKDPSPTRPSVAAPQRRGRDGIGIPGLAVSCDDQLWKDMVVLLPEGLLVLL